MVDLTRLANTAAINGLTMAEIEARYPGRDNAAMLISTTMENIGVMTFRCGQTPAYEACRAWNLGSLTNKM